MFSIIKNMRGLGLIAIVVIVILVAFIFPLAYLWALNTLFPALAIPYTIDTWLAAIILAGLFSASVSKKD